MNNYYVPGLISGGSVKTAKAPNSTESGALVEKEQTRPNILIVP
jgi:hypothetical protein